MRVGLAAAMLLGMGQAAWAEKPQPFIDYAALFALHATKVTVDTSNFTQTVRVLDLGDGLRVLCAGLEGFDCRSQGPTEHVVDMGCILSGLVMLTREADCVGILDDQQSAAISRMMDQSAGYLAENGLPRRDAAAIKAAAFAWMDAEIVRWQADGDDLCGRLVDPEGLDRRWTDSNVHQVTSPAFALRFTATLSKPRLPVTECGEWFGDLAP